MNTSVSLVLALLAAGCAGTSSSTRATEEPAPSSIPTTAASPPPSTAPAAPIAVVPLRLRLSEGDAGHRVAELQADGTISIDGRIVGRIDGTRVLDAQGDVALEVSADGHLSAPGNGPGAQLTDDGALVASDSSMVVTPEGTIEERAGARRIRIAPFRFESLPPGSLRTAIVFVAFVGSMPAEPPPLATTVVASPAPALDAGTPPADAGTTHARRHR